MIAINDELQADLLRKAIQGARAPVRLGLARGLTPEQVHCGMMGFKIPSGAAQLGHDAVVWFACLYSVALDEAIKIELAAMDRGPAGEPGPNATSLLFDVRPE